MERHFCCRVAKTEHFGTHSGFHVSKALHQPLLSSRNKKDVSYFIRATITLRTNAQSLTVLLEMNWLIKLKPNWEFDLRWLKSATHNHISVMTYPRPPSAALSCRPSRSTRGATGCVSRCGSGAVAAHGCRTHTQRAAAQAARSRPANCGSRGPWRRLPQLRSDGQAVAAALQRLVEKWSTGGRAEQASNTARGTPEKRRTCGLHIRIAFVPRGAKARGSPGLTASRAALTIGRRAARIKARAQRAARTREAVWKWN